MQKLFKLIDGEVIFGEVEPYIGEDNATQILIKTPFCAKPAGIMPYMIDLLQCAPPAIVIHPINVLWCVELDNFPEVHKIYNDATSVLVKPESKIII